MENGAMQMVGATGGLIIMVFYVLMLVLSVLVPFFVWRIWKWSFTTSQELKQLNEKFDQFLTLQQSGVPVETVSSPAPAAALAAAWATQEEEPETGTEPSQADDPLAKAFDLGSDEEANEEQLADKTEETADVAEEEPAALPEDEPAESGFEFSVSPEEAFGADEPTEEPADEEPSAEDPFAFDEEDEDLATPAAESADVFTESPAEESDLGGDFAADDSAFEFGGEEEADAENLSQDFDSGFGEEEPAAEEQDEEDPFAGFGEESAEQGFGKETETEEPEAEEFAPEPEPEAETEETPAIIALESDPQRPTVKLARCGQCDHKLAYKDSLSGKKARCPSCQSAFTLP